MCIVITIPTCDRNVNESPPYINTHMLEDIRFQTASKHKINANHNPVLSDAIW